jgi:hypothetical protein
MGKEGTEVGKEVTMAKRRSQSRPIKSRTNHRRRYRWDTPRDVSINVRLLIARGEGEELVVGDSDDRPTVALLAMEEVDSSSESGPRPSLPSRDL